MLCSFTQITLHLHYDWWFATCSICCFPIFLMLSLSYIAGSCTIVQSLIHLYSAAHQYGPTTASLVLSMWLFNHHYLISSCSHQVSAQFNWFTFIVIVKSYLLPWYNSLPFIWCAYHHHLLERKITNNTSNNTWWYCVQAILIWTCSSTALPSSWW